MNRALMITYFRELYELSSHTNDSKDDDQIDVYLNLAQNEFVNDQFKENKEGIIELKNSKKSIDNLRTLMVTGTSLSLSIDTEIVNAKITTFPADMRYYTGVRTQLIRNDSTPTQSWYLCNWINPSEVWKYVVNGKNSPVIHNPLYTVFNNKLYIISEAVSIVTINAAKLDYIKEPVTITNGTDCELPDNTHFKIVENAVNIALKSSSIEPSNKLGMNIQEGRQ